MAANPQKHTLWNTTSDAWEETPQNIEITDNLNQQIEAAFSEEIDEKEVRSYRTPADREQLAKIIG